MIDLDQLAGYVMLGLVVCFLGHGLATGFSFDKPIRKKVFIPICSLALTAWLWGPWVWLGFTKLYKANLNEVNRVSQPDTVLPVPGKTYRADEVKKGD